MSDYTDYMKMQEAQRRALAHGGTLVTKSDWGMTGQGEGVSGNPYSGEMELSRFKKGKGGTGVRGRFKKNGVWSDEMEQEDPVAMLFAIINDPMFVPIGFSIAGGLCAFGLSLNPEILKLVVPTAGRIVEGFTPGRLTDIGDI